MNNKKVKVTERQFSEVLYSWLSDFMTEKVITEIAKEIDFDIKNSADFNIIFEEFLSLNIWLVVYTCEGVIKNEDKRNKYLDVFHKLIYERHIKKEESFNTWLQSMGLKYIAYDKAIKTDHPSTPLWVIATLINKNLFGEVKKDPFLQMRLTTHIGLFVEHLGNAIKQYEIK